MRSVRHRRSGRRPGYGQAGRAVSPERCDGSRAPGCRPTSRSAPDAASTSPARRDAPGKRTDGTNRPGLRGPDCRLAFHHQNPSSPAETLSIKPKSAYQLRKSGQRSAAATVATVATTRITSSTATANPSRPHGGQIGTNEGDARMENISLTALAREQLELAQSASSGRSAHTVYGVTSTRCARP